MTGDKLPEKQGICIRKKYFQTNIMLGENLVNSVYKLGVGWSHSNSLSKGARRVSSREFRRACGMEPAITFMEVLLIQLEP
jgi:hypothetical protein